MHSRAYVCVCVSRRLRQRQRQLASAPAVPSVAPASARARCRNRAADMTRGPRCNVTRRRPQGRRPGLLLLFIRAEAAAAMSSNDSSLAACTLACRVCLGLRHSSSAARVLSGSVPSHDTGAGCVRSLAHAARSPLPLPPYSFLPARSAEDTVVFAAVRSGVVRPPCYLMRQVTLPLAT